MIPSSRALFASGLTKEYGNNRLPPNAVSSCGWLLTTDVGQLTDLARWGLPHPDRCLLSDQDKNIQHHLIGCVFARQFWYSLLQQVGLCSLASHPPEPSFDDWWAKVEASVSGDAWKGLNTPTVLGAWSIWMHQNDCLQWDCPKCLHGTKPH